MQLGGYAPLPCGLGGGPSMIELHLQSLNQQRGTGYDLTSSADSPGAASPVWVENMCVARALADLDETNERLSNVTDPAATPFLSRWERIFGLPAQPGATESDRRAVLADAWSRIGGAPTRQEIIDRLSSALGLVFVAYWQIPTSIAVVSTNPWNSTNANVLVQTTTPAGYSEAQYQAAIGKVGPIMDWALPAWAYWTVYRNDPGHVGGGFWPDTGAGFFLDTTHNLDNQIFDV